MFNHALLTAPPMHCSSGLLHNLTAPPLIGVLTVSLTSPEDGHITGVSNKSLHYRRLPQGSLVRRSSASSVWPQGSEEKRRRRARLMSADRQSWQLWFCFAVWQRTSANIKLYMDYFIMYMSLMHKLKLFQRSSTSTWWPFLAHFTAFTPNLVLFYWLFLLFGI